MRRLCLVPIVTLNWKQMECRLQNPRKTRTEPLVRGALVSRGAVYARYVQRLQLVLISRTKDINLPRNMRLKLVTSLKVRKNGQQKACNLFCSNVARQVARFLLLVFPYLNHIGRVFTENDNWYLEFECDWLLNKIHLARDRAAVVTDRAAFV